MNKQRERLIEMLNEWGNKENDGVRAESIADYLLANGVIVPNNNLKLNRNRYIQMIDTYLEEPHSISREWVELLKIMREIIEGEGRNES